MDMNYGPGTYECNPKIYSSNIYINKHMNSLGLPFLTKKIIDRFNRTEKMRKIGMGVHYTQNIDEIEKRYKNNLNNCQILD